MRPCPSPTSRSALLVFTMILSIGVHFPAIWCQGTQPFDKCGQSVQCGDIQLKYPFWGLDRPAYCGHPDFELTCQSNVSVLNYQSLNYRVLDIDTPTYTITIARNDLWNTSCPQFLYNTTYNSTLFNGNDFGQQDVSLYYNCPYNASQIPLGANYRFNCYLNDGYFSRTDLIAPNIANFLVQCETHIDVPVSQSSGDRLGAAGATKYDMTAALMAGFNLRWTANKDECNRCIQSNGQCGSNSIWPDLFACYCANGNFPFTCNNTNGGEGSD